MTNCLQMPRMVLLCSEQRQIRFSVYRTFCTVHDENIYSLLNIEKHFKYIVTWFRLGVPDIDVHHFRYKRHTDNGLICPLCTEVQEVESHFVSCCPMSNELRVQFIPLKFHRFPSFFRSTLLLASRNESIVRNVLLYLYHALKLRSVIRS